MKPRRRKRVYDYPDDAVLSDYTATPALKGKSSEALHMFFSPWRIPVGLTDEEVGICVALYLLRKTQDSTNEYDWRPRKNLPEELRPDRVMTRARFRQGIWKFLKEVAS